MTIKKRNQSDTISFKYLDIKESYRILKTFTFSSERKMMSVIVKRESDGQVIIYTKGADALLLPRIS